jgi:integrase
MATIEHRPGGCWRAKVRKRGYPQQSKTFNTKAHAHRWAIMVESEMERGAFKSLSEANATTLGELFERYLGQVTPLKKGAEPERVRLLAMLRDPICRFSLAALRPADIAKYRDKRAVMVSAGTILKELSLISHAIDIGILDWGIHLPSNPGRYVRRPAMPRPRDRRLTHKELEPLRSSLTTGSRNPWVLPVFEFAIETAMRRSEILGLKACEVSLERRTAHLEDTKNGGARTVPLSTTAVETVKQLPRDEEYVFPITASGLKQGFERAVKRAGITDFRFHDLRHEATSRLFEKGLNIMEVSAITGHKDLGMLKRYTHLRAEDLARKLG